MTARTASLTLLSHGPGAARNPSVTRDGGSIVFESDANLTGGNPSGTQLFLHRRNKAALQQLTAAPGGACTKPAIASDGHAVAFLSSDNLLGLGTTGPEVYSYNLKKNFLVQLTNAPANVSDPSLLLGCVLGLPRRRRHRRKREPGNPAVSHQSLRPRQRPNRPLGRPRLRRIN